MITVKIELWPHGDESKSREIGRMYIANVTNPQEKDVENIGDYAVAVCRRGTTDLTKHAPARVGKVLDYPRLSYNVWRLISRAIRSAFPEEK